MPTRAKPIDPNRVRLAARGQWSQLNTTSTTSPLHTDSTQNVTRTFSSNSSTSNSSSSSATAQRTGRDMKNNVSNATKKGKGEVVPAFLTNTRSIDDGSETSDSDPELYRAARERTKRFLYPNERPFAKSTALASGSTGSSSTKKNTGNEQLVDSKNIAVTGKGSAVLSTSTMVTTVEAQAYGGSDSREKEAKNITGVTENNSSKFKKDNEVDDDTNTDSDRSPLRTSPPLVVQEALRGTVDPTVSASQREFSRLLELLADDDQAERSKAQQENVTIPVPTHVEDPFSAHPQKKQQDQKEESGGLKCYVRPPRTFAEFQDKVLLQLYNTQEEKGDAKYFIATDHTSEAFTLASLEVAAAKAEYPSEQWYADPESSFALGQREGYVKPYDAPLSLMEIVNAERVRCNARAALHKRIENGEEPISSCNADALMSADADVLAVTAEKSLNRFLESVRYIEAMVRNRRVMDALGSFLYQHHKLFFQSGVGDGQARDVIREYSHEAFVVYEMFSRRVSSFLLHLLKRRVAYFNAEEFVLTLYDVNLQSDKPYKHGDDKEYSDSDGRHGDCGSTEAMDVLSYPARRLLQSMSSFNEFCTFMDGFIAEEYGVEKVVVTDEKDGVSVNGSTFRTAEDDVVVTAGARGIRALLKKSPPPPPPLTTEGTTLSPSLAQGSTLELSPKDGSTDNDIRDVLSLEDRDVEALTGAQQKEQEQQQEASLFTEGISGHVETTSAQTVGSHPTFSPLSRAPPPQSATAPRSSVASSQGSLHTSQPSFSAPQRVPRRPEAVLGRNLPPIATRSTGEGEGRQSTVPSRSVQGLQVPAERIAGGSATVPGTREKRGKADNSSMRGRRKSPAGRAQSKSAGSGNTRSNRGDSGSRSGTRQSREPTSGVVATKVQRRVMKGA